MSNMTESPATTPIPVQISEAEFIAFIFPHPSMPRRGPSGIVNSTRGYDTRLKTQPVFMGDQQ
jgi:hypothetical protein